MEMATSCSCFARHAVPQTAIFVYIMHMPGSWGDHGPQLPGTWTSPTDSRHTAKRQYSHRSRPLHTWTRPMDTRCLWGILDTRVGHCQPLSRTRSRPMDSPVPGHTADTPNGRWLRRIHTPTHPTNSHGRERTLGTSLAIRWQQPGRIWFVSMGIHDFRWTLSILNVHLDNLFAHRIGCTVFVIVAVGRYGLKQNQREVTKWSDIMVGWDCGSPIQK